MQVNTLFEPYCFCLPRVKKTLAFKRLKLQQVCVSGSVEKRLQDKTGKALELSSQGTNTSGRIFLCALTELQAIQGAAEESCNAIVSLKGNQ